MTRADEREAVKRIFEARDAGDTEYLLRALRDPDLRGQAAKWLADQGEQRAIQPLMLLLDAHDPIARAAAARALGRLGALGAAARLLELAEGDPNEAARSWALSALATMKQPQAVPLLTPMLAHPKRRQRRYAAERLGAIGNTAATAALTDAKQREHWFNRGPHRRALRAARRAA